MENGKKKVVGAKILVMAVVVILILLGIMLTYTKLQRDQVISQTENAISQNTQVVAGMVDSSIGYALSSIQVTAQAISNEMQSDVLTEPDVVISQYIANTPFSNIEYIRGDGMVWSNTEPVDAHERECYIKGIAGKIGIWIDYQPKYAKEPILNYYAPLYYAGNVVGVLNGTIGGNASIAPFFLSKFSKQPVAGMLLDKDYKLIASTEKFEPGLAVDWNTANVYEEYKQDFFDAILRADGTPIDVGGKDGSSAASVSMVKSTGWRVVQIVPSTSMKAMMKSSNTATFWTIGVMLGVCVLFFTVILLENRKISRYSISKANMERDEQISVLVSMSDVYYSMHLINLKENSLVEYAARNEVKEIVSKGLPADQTVREIMLKTMTDESLEYALEFTDLETLPQRMKNKKHTYAELLGKNVGWIRFSYIALETDDDGYPEKVICTTEVIDEEKRREEQLIIKSNTDELTKFLNRRAYEAEIASYQTQKIEDNLVYMAIDINGLKVMNDTKGHDVGDELICGAASCMKRCFGIYGKLFRTGGDEFIALLHASARTLEDIKSDFEETVAGWSGREVDSISVSYGYVTRREFPDSTIEEMAKVADQRMYEAKSAYYKNKGMDRRGQQAAHTALCKLYTKILKVNLTEDLFEIVQMNKEEQSLEKGFSNRFSAWIRQFGETGQVHPDDLEEYYAKSSAEYLKKTFAGGITETHFYYRRKIGDEYKLVMMEMIPADDYEPETQKIYLYVRPMG